MESSKYLFFSKFIKIVLKLLYITIIGTTFWLLISYFLISVFGVQIIEFINSNSSILSTTTVDTNSPPSSASNLSQHASLGDTFGIVNSLTTSLAFFVVAFSLILQQRDIKITMRNNSEILEQMKQQTDVNIVHLHLEIVAQKREIERELSLVTDPMEQRDRKRTLEELDENLKYLSKFLPKQ